MCAAPNSAYLTEKLPLQDVGVVKYDNLLALKLSEYGANIKSLFYLDALLVAKENGGAKEGFCGMVIVGSANAAMHNTARYGKGRTSPDGGATKYIILNDGGLNTFGFGSISSFSYQWANNIGINIYYLSAYYVNSDSLGIRIKKTSDSTWTEIIFGDTLSAADNITSLRHINPTFDPLDSVDIQVIVVNDEGTFYSATTTISVGDNVFSYGVLKRSLACSTSGQEGVIVWIKEAEFSLLPTVTTSDANTGIFLYTDVTMTTKQGAGWYYGLGGNKSFQVNSNGEIRLYQECGGGLPVATLTFEQNIDGWYRFKVNLSETYTSDITVSFRVDITPEVTINAKYITITVPAGDLTKNDPLYRNLSDNTYHIYDDVISPSGITLIVTPI